MNESCKITCSGLAVLAAGALLVPITGGSSIPLALCMVGGSGAVTGLGVTALTGTIAGINKIRISRINDMLRREMDGLNPILLTMIKSTVSISGELYDFQKYWEKQDQAIAEIQKKLGEGRINKARVRIISEHLKDVKNRLEEYISDVGRALVFDKMTN